MTLQGQEEYDVVNISVCCTAVSWQIKCKHHLLVPSGAPSLFCWSSRWSKFWLSVNHQTAAGTQYLVFVCLCLHLALYHQNTEGVKMTKLS